MPAQWQQRKHAGALLLFEHHISERAQEDRSERSSRHSLAPVLGREVAEEPASEAATDPQGL